MVGFAPILGVAALYAGVIRAAPAPDSSYGSSNSGSSGSSYGSSGNSYGNSGSSYGSSDNSYGSSDNSYGSSGNSYGSSGNSYGSSGNSYGSQNSYGGNSYNANSGNSYSSSSSPSSSVWSTSTTTSSTYTAMATSTSSYSMPSYGSGSSSWNMGSGYNDCVQQCVASYGGPSATASWPSETSSYGSSGTGATHTVIVAPTQGVLRYIPFATNASVGDTVKFVWGAGPHTVTKSSELTPCNKTSDSPFASGMQNKSFVFTQVVNDTNPSFYYCGVPGHCEKGMFGIINPPSQYNNAGSASNMIPQVAKNYSSTAAAWSYTQNATMSNSAAQSWGNNIDMSQLPSWSWPYASENVLYTRAFLAQNSETMQSDGSVDLGAIGSNPLMIPNDVAAAAGSNNAAAATSSSSSSSTASSYGSASASPSGSPVAASSKSGAGAISVSRGAVALVAVAAAFFAL